MITRQGGLYENNYGKPTYYSPQSGLSCFFSATLVYILANPSPQKYFSKIDKSPRNPLLENKIRRFANPAKTQKLHLLLRGVFICYRG